MKSKNGSIYVIAVFTAIIVLIVLVLVQSHGDQRKLMSTVVIFSNGTIVDRSIYPYMEAAELSFRSRYPSLVDWTPRGVAFLVGGNHLIFDSPPEKFDAAIFYYKRKEQHSTTIEVSVSSDDYRKYSVTFIEGK